MIPRKGKAEFNRDLDASFDRLIIAWELEGRPPLSLKTQAELLGVSRKFIENLYKMALANANPKLRKWV